MAKIVPSPDTRRLLEKKALHYHTQLQGSLGQKYLEARGITKEAQSSFLLGFVQDSFPDDSHLRGRIAIPYITRAGVVGIKYRATHEEASTRYLYNPGFYGARIFNVLDLNSRNTKIYICEGEIDCITIAQLGIPAIALPGVDTFQPKMSRALRNRSCIVLADDDDNGQGKNFAKKILSCVDDSAMIVMDGNDVNSYYQLHGQEALLGKIGWNQDSVLLKMTN